MKTREQSTVLVTGASGRVGGEVHRQLKAAGVRVRAATRHPKSLPLDGRDDTVAVDLADPGTLELALMGVDAVFLMWPFFESIEDARRKVAPIAQMLGANVRRVVYLSSQSVESDPGGFWGGVEEAVAEQVQEWTVLRPTGFAGNARQWAPQIIGGDDVIRGPFGQMARPLIHETDIAAAAVATLLNDCHLGHHYVITGPERITQEAQVELIGAAIDRPLRWQELDRDEAQLELGLPDVMLDAWEAFLTEPEPVTDVVQRLSGRPAHTFAEWVQQHASLFR